MALLNRSQLFLALSVVFLSILLYKRGNQRRHYQIYIQNVNPNDVWELMSDFRNIAKLNQKIKSFQIRKGGQEKGSDRQYRVVSQEAMMADWLFGTNVNYGEIQTKTITNKQKYTIVSTFVTYSFWELLIIDNASEVTLELSKDSEGETATKYTEVVTMNCPLLLSQFCNVETDQNRKEFFKNLKYHYDNV